MTAVVVGGVGAGAFAGVSHDGRGAQKPVDPEPAVEVPSPSIAATAPASPSVQPAEPAPSIATRARLRSHGS